jgi:hypothetical protein
MSSRARRLPALFVLLFAVSACGSGSNGGGGGGGADAGIGADGQPGSPDGGMDPDGFVDLITGTWTLQPGTERYWCARKTITEDLYITGFRAAAPPGTHHTVLSVGPPQGADGEGSCTAFANRDVMLYASGVGTDDWFFPEGVAVKIEAGQQILLNLHLFNASDFAMDGVSGTRVKLVSEAEVSELAEMVFAGPLNIVLQPTGQPATVKGSCTFSETATVLNVWPHMHQLGRHMLVEHGEAVLHDDDYDFAEQRNHPLAPPVVVGAGQRLDVTCTFVNDTGKVVTWGDSSEEEMCFAGFYRVPAASAGIYCSS